MTTGAILEVLAALALIGVGVWQYRKRIVDGSRTGSQGAVFLFLIAAIMLMHGFGLFKYRPSAGEIERQGTIVGLSA